MQVLEVYDSLCDIAALDEFLTLVDAIPVRNAGGDTIALSPTDLPNEGSVIEVLSYNFGDGVSAGTFPVESN